MAHNVKVYILGLPKGHETNGFQYSMVYIHNVIKVTCNNTAKRLLSNLIKQRCKSAQNSTVGCPNCYYYRILCISPIINIENLTVMQKQDEREKK